MAEDNPRELADSVFRHELKASEAMTELWSDHDVEDAEQAMLESFESLMERIDSPRRAEKTIMLMQTLAQRLESEALLEKAIREAEENPMVSVPEEEQ